MALKRLSPKESIAFFKQALAYDGANPGVLQNLAVTYDLYLNDVANARKAYVASHNALAPRKDVKGMMAIRKRLIQLERRNGGK